MINYAESLESYLIPAEEGQNIDTVRSIRKSSEYEEMLSTLKSAKALEKAARKDKKNPECWKNALDEYEKIPELIIKLKQKIDNEPELDGFWQKVFSNLTPIWEWRFPEDEVNNFIYIPLGNSSYTYIERTTYHDELSNKTNSAVKRSYQQRMNLFIKNTNSKISFLKAKIKKLS